MTSSICAFFHNAFILHSAIKEKKEWENVFECKVPDRSLFNTYNFYNDVFFSAHFQFIMNYSYKILDGT